METQSNLEANLRAIETINQQDMQFAMANDLDRMMSQWADDIVVLSPSGPIQRGRKAIAEESRGVGQSIEILEYVLDMQEVKVLGDYAYQWGTYRYRLRPRTGGEPILTGGKIMRILQRQPDGSWKIFRGISNVDQPTP